MESQFRDLARIIFWYLAACGGRVAEGTAPATVPGFRSAVIGRVPLGPQLIVTPTAFNPVLTGALSTLVSFAPTLATPLSFC